MNFPSALPLKPLDTDRFPAVQAPSRLSSLDMMGAIAHQGAEAAAPAGEASDAQHEQLVKFTQQWVAQTFFGTLMRQMRESPFKSDLFEGGRGGQAFTGLYDQKLVEQMARGAGNKLVNSIVRTIEKNLRKTQAGEAYDKQRKVDAAAVTGAGVGPRGATVPGSASQFVRADVAPAH